MVAVIAGQGLGLFNSSINALGGQGVRGNASLANLGSSSTQAGSLYVNASSGNLILQNLDEKVSGMGADLQYLRTYNSQGQWNDGGQGNWRHVGQRNLVITGTLGAGGSQITRIAADGSQTVYNFDKLNKVYRSTDGGGAHDSIRMVTRDGEEMLQWLEGSTEIAEYYDQVTGQLLEQEDANGNVVQFKYDDSDRLFQVVDLGSEQRIELQYDDDDRVESISTVSESSGNLIRQVHYDYYSDGRLREVQVDLTPEDSSIADNFTIRTVYGYHDGTDQIKDITRYENGNTPINVVSGIIYDSNNRVESITDLNGTTTFDYSSPGVTRVTNAEGSIKDYSYTGDLLTGVKSYGANGSVVEHIQYAYNDNDDVIQIKNGDQDLRYFYDANGNRVLEVDAEGNYLSRIFSSDNLLLSETQYTDASSHAMPALQQQAGDLPTIPNDLGDALRNIYAYDLNRNIRFSVSPERRVTEYQYNGYGLLEKTIQYNDVLAENTPPYLADPIGVRNVVQGQPFSFKIPDSTFMSLDGGSLTYSATDNVGGELPAWLSFDAATKTFSGTPTEQGAFSIVLTAQDASGNTVSDVLAINIAEPNNPPVGTDFSTFGFSGGAVTFSFENLLAKASDADGDLLSVVGVENAVNGQVDFDVANGRVVFSSNAGFTGTASFDYIVSDSYGGTVTVTVTINVLEATIVGTSGDDDFSTSDGDDVVFTLGGDDTVRSHSGSDQIFTGSGNDMVRLYTEVDSDVYVNLGDDDDTLFGNVTIGGSVTYNGTVTVDAGDGNDTVNAGAFSDYIVNLGDGDDTGKAYADHSNDYADVALRYNEWRGGLGNDNFITSASSDTFYFDRGDGHDRISENGHSFDTVDRIIFGEGIEQSHVTVNGDVHNVVITIANPDDPEQFDSITILSGLQGQSGDRQRLVEELVFADGSVLDLQARIDFATYLGTEGDDTYSDATIDDIIYTYGGDDEVTSRGGNDYIDVGDGNDTVTLQSGNELTLRQIILGDGENTLHAHNARGTVYVSAGDGNDIFRSNNYVSMIGLLGDGDDFVSIFDISGTPEVAQSLGNSWVGGTGNDTFFTGAHLDTYTFNRGDGHDSITDKDTILSGNKDRILLGGGITPDQVQLSYHSQILTLTIHNPDNPALNDSIKIRLPSNAEDRAQNYIEEVMFTSGDVYRLDQIADQVIDGDVVDDGTGIFMSDFPAEDSGGIVFPDNMNLQSNSVATGPNYNFHNLNLSNYSISNDSAFTASMAQQNNVGTAQSATDAGFSASGVATGADTLLNYLSEWSLNIEDLSQVQLSELMYDGFGNVERQVTFGEVDQSGQGILNTKANITEFVYDAHGNLIDSISVHDGVRSVTSHYAYDGAGRLDALTNVSGSTNYTYDANAREIRAVDANNLTATQKFDAQGKLLNTSLSASGEITRTTEFFYDSAGRLRMTEAANGGRAWIFYDAAGRVEFEVGAEGAVTGYVYDAQGQIESQTRYAKAVDTDGWFTGSVDWKNDESFTKDSLIAGSDFQVDAENDRQTRYIYDDAGRVFQTIEEFGDKDRITETIYDGASRVTSITVGDSRHTRFFYSDDGLLIGSINADGNFVENTYDNIGRLEKATRYDTEIASSSILSIDFSSVPRSGEKLSSYYFYDTQGRQIGVVDEQGFLTVTDYSSDELKKDVTRYLNPISVGANDTLADLQAAALANEGEKRTSSTFFDEFGRVEKTVGHDNTVSLNIYDETNGRLIRTVAAFEQDDRGTRMRYNAFGEVTGVVSGKGEVLVGTSVNGALYSLDDAIEDYGMRYTYNSVGQKIIEQGPEGERNQYYYDSANRLRYTTNGEQNISRINYNTFGEVASTRQHTNTTSGLSDTYYGASVKEIDKWSDNNANISSDIVTKTDYNKLGLVSATIDAYDVSTKYHYDKYGDLENVVTPTGTYGARVYTTTSFVYDNLGRLTNTTADVGGLNYETITEYDGLGRVVGGRDAKGNWTRTVYQQNGREVVINNALSQQVSRTITDAFGRVTERYDAYDKLTSYSYDDNARSMTETSATGAVTTTERNRHGEVSKVTAYNSLENGTYGSNTSFYYDKNGNLEYSQNHYDKRTYYYYDNSGNLTSKKDARGNEIFYDYDKAGRLEHEYGATVNKVYQYNGLGQKEYMIQGADAEAVTTEYIYDRNGRLKSEILDPTGLKLTTNYLYNVEGTVRRIEKGDQDDPAQYVVEYGYDILGRKTSETVDPDGLALTTEYLYDANSNLMRIKTENGDNDSNTWFAYNELNQLTLKLDGEGYATSYEYNNNGQLIHTRRHYQQLTEIQMLPLRFGSDATLDSVDITIPTGYQERDRREINVYDDDGRLRFTLTSADYEDDSVASTWVVTENVYDDASNIIETRRFDKGFNDSYVNNLFNNGIFEDEVIESLEGLGYAFRNWGPEKYSYINEVELGARRTYFSYDRLNQLRYTINAENGLNENIYDDVGNIVKQIQYAKDDINFTSKKDFEIDDYVSLIRNSSQNRMKEFVYDSHNRIEKEYLPEEEFYIQAYGHRPYFYENVAGYRTRTDIEYDSLGRVSSRTEGRIEDVSDGGIRDHHAQTTSFEYDNANRQVLTTLSGYYHETYGAVLSAQHDDWYKDSNGNVINTPETARYQRTIAVTYDDLGNAVRNSTRIGANLYADQYKTYDAANRVKHEVDALGFVTEYGYDKVGNVTTINRFKNHISLANHSEQGKYFLEDEVNPSDESRLVVQQYDAVGNLVEVDVYGAEQNWESSRSNVDSIERDYGLGYQLFGVYQDKLITKYTYNAFGERVATSVKRNKLGDETSWATSFNYYDRLGRNVLTMDAGGYGTREVYNLLGDKITTIEYADVTTTPDIEITVHSKPEFSNSLITSINESSHDRIYSFDYDKMGRVTSTYQHNFSAVEKIPSEFNLSYKKVTYAGMNKEQARKISENTYNAFGELIKQSDIEGKETEYFYDNLGRLIRTEGPFSFYDVSEDQYGSGLSQKITEYGYDVGGNLIKELKRSGIGTNYEQAHESRYYYDFAGNLVRQTIAGKESENQYYNSDEFDSDIYFKNDAHGKIIEERQIIDVSHNTANQDAFSMEHEIRTSYRYDKTGRQIERLQFYVEDGIEKNSGELVDYNAFGEITHRYAKWGNESSTSRSIIERYGYDDAGRVMWTQDAGGYDYYYYNLTGNVTRLEERNADGETYDAEIRATETYYDILDRAIVKRLPSYGVTTFDLTTSGLGETTSNRTPLIRQSYDRWGNVTQVSDPAVGFSGEKTNFMYNHANQVVTEYRASQTEVLSDNGQSYNARTKRTISYDLFGNLAIDSVEVNGNGLDKSKTSYNFYDSRNNLIESRDATDVRQYFTYNLMDNRVSSISEMGVKHRFDYDALGNMTQRKVRRYSEYHVLNEYKYDKAGRRFADIDALGNAAYTKYDERSNVKQTINKLNGKVTFSYDAVGNKTRQVEEVDVGETKTRQLWVPEPSHPYGGYWETETYLEWTDEDVVQEWGYNITTSFGQNKLRSFSTLHASDSQDYKTYSYLYDQFGRLEKEYIEGEHEITYTYTDNGLLESKNEWEDTSTFYSSERNRTSTFTYDIQGNRTSEKYDEIAGSKTDNGNYVTSQERSQNTYFEYDLLNRLVRVKSPSTVISSDSMGPGVPGVPTDQQTADVQLLEYAYDEFGNRRKVSMEYIQIPDTNQANSSREYWYKYDKEGRVLLEKGELFNGEIVAGRYSAAEYIKHDSAVHTYNNDGQRATTEKYDHFSVDYGSGIQTAYYEQTRYVYNDLGFVEHEFTRDISRSYGGYINDGTGVSFGEDHALTTEYDDRGFQKKVIDHIMAKSSVTDYDNNGNVIYTKVSATFSTPEITRYVTDNYTYDKAGNLRGYTYYNYSQGDTTYREYDYEYKGIYNGFKNTKITVDTDEQYTDVGKTTNTYDMSGNLIGASITEQKAGSGTGITTRTFFYDAEGKIAQRSELKAGESNFKTQSFYNHGSNQIASAGDSGVTFTPISSQHAATSVPGTYIVNIEDTLGSIAQKMFGDSSLWYVIADANGITKGPQDTFGAEDAGRVLTIPNTQQNLRNDSTTFKPYNPTEIIGDLTPDVKMLPPPNQGCSAIATLVVIAVAVVATAVTSGLIAAALTPGLSVGTAVSVAFSGVGALVSAGAGPGALLVAGAVGGYVGSVASQAVAVGFDLQESIDWDAAKSAGISGGISSGLSSPAGSAHINKLRGFSKFAANFVQGAQNYLVNQVANRAAGVEASFSWKALLANSTGNAVGTALTQNGGDGFWGNTAGKAINNSITGKLMQQWAGAEAPDYGMIAVDAFGNQLGNWIGQQATGGNVSSGAQHATASEAKASVKENILNDSVSQSQSVVDDKVDVETERHLNDVVKFRQPPETTSIIPEQENMLEEVIIRAQRGENGEEVNTTAEIVTRGVVENLTYIKGKGGQYYSVRPGYEPSFIRTQTAQAAKEWDEYMANEPRGVSFSPMEVELGEHDHGWDLAVEWGVEDYKKWAADVRNGVQVFRDTVDSAFDVLPSGFPINPNDYLITGSLAAAVEWGLMFTDAAVEGAAYILSEDRRHDIHDEINMNLMSASQFVLNNLGNEFDYRISIKTKALIEGYEAKLILGTDGLRVQFKQDDPEHLQVNSIFDKGKTGTAYRFGINWDLNTFNDQGSFAPSISDFSLGYSVIRQDDKYLGDKKLAKMGVRAGYSQELFTGNRSSFSGRGSFDYEFLRLKNGKYGLSLELRSTPMSSDKNDPLI
ncbi:putative deoxyribonuclease RhsB [Thalassocella blandensis]|nr:putative deoxyribonuclease RhsB [Thalassocella blandensis]